MTKIHKWQNLGSSVSQTLSTIVELGRTKKFTKNPPSSQTDGKDTSLLLNMLPVELLLIIVDQLDVVDQVCLQSTNRFFHQFSQVDRAALEGDKCRKWAITCCFEDDMKEYPAKIACAFCKTVRRKKLFEDWKRLKIGNYSIRLPYRPRCKPPSPMARYCNAHRKDMFTDLNSLVLKSSMHFKATPATTQAALEPRWVYYAVLRCWHCARCIAQEDLRKTGCLHCLCDFCPRFKDCQYFRSGPCVPGGGRYRYEIVRSNVWVIDEDRQKVRGHKKYVGEIGSE